MTVYYYAFIDTDAYGGYSEPEFQDLTAYGFKYVGNTPPSDIMVDPATGIPSGSSQEFWDDTNQVWYYKKSTLLTGLRTLRDAKKLLPLTVSGITVTPTVAGLASLAPLVELARVEDPSVQRAWSSGPDSNSVPMDNATFLTVFDTASAALQHANDAELPVVDAINNGSLTTPGDVAAAYETSFAQPNVTRSKVTSVFSSFGSDEAAITALGTTIDSRIQTVIGTAPSNLDTLGEISTQLANDESASAAIVTTLSNKVDKVSGKSLSTNDYTTAEQTKLAGIATGATANSSDAFLLSRTNHTGTQTSSTISDFSTAVNSLVSTKINALINGADAAHDTLKEIQDIMTGDESTAAALATTVGLKADKTYVDSQDTTKVDKVSGKSLWSASDVLSTVLSGFSAVTNAAVTATDTVLSAIGKLQAQVTALAALLPPAFAFSTPTFASATTATKLSSTRPVWCSYSPVGNINITLLAGQSVTATLSYADDAAMSVNVVNFCQNTLSSSGVLGLAQGNGLTAAGILPPNKYRKLTLTSTGSPTLPTTLAAAQEVIM